MWYISSAATALPKDRDAEGSLFMQDIPCCSREVEFRSPWSSGDERNRGWQRERRTVWLQVYTVPVYDMIEHSFLKRGYKFTFFTRFLYRTTYVCCEYWDSPDTHLLTPARRPS